MRLKLLFEGESDRLALLRLFEIELDALIKRGVDVRAIDYGGRRRGFTRLIARQITYAFEQESIDKVIVQIDSESDSPAQMQTILTLIRSRVPTPYHRAIVLVVIDRCLESVLLAGCLNKARDYEQIPNPKVAVAALLKKHFKQTYRETLHAPEYAAKIDKTKACARITGAKIFSDLITQLS